MQSFNSAKLFLGTTFVAASVGLSLPAMAAPSADFFDGKTSVVLSRDFTQALTTLKARPGTIGAGRLKQGVATFPITSGAADLNPLKIEVNHRGGLSLTTSKTIVQLTDYSITNLDGKLILTGLVKSNDSLVGRLPLFDLTLTREQVTQTIGELSKIEVAGVQLKLTKTAATTLNSAFQVTTFQAGLNIGTAKVNGLAQNN
jgi:hypothetical protein